jgi:hypothetical protein
MGKWALPCSSEQAPPAGFEAFKLAERGSQNQLWNGDGHGCHMISDLCYDVYY